MKIDKVILERPNKIIYRDGDNCVKLFDSNFSKIDILNESLNQARVEQLDLNVPKIITISINYFIRSFKNYFIYFHIINPLLHYFSFSIICIQIHLFDFT